MHKTCRDKNFGSLISPIDRNSTNIEERKEKAIKNFRKLEATKLQHSHRVEKGEVLGETNDEDRKKK